MNGKGQWRVLFFMSLLVVPFARGVTLDRWIAFFKPKLPDYANSACHAYVTECYRVEREECRKAAMSAASECLDEKTKTAPLELSTSDQENWKYPFTECVGTKLKVVLAPKKIGDKKCVTERGWMKSKGIRSRFHDGVIGE